jgi:DNA-binding response OmpR family regulator
MNGSVLIVDDDVNAQIIAETLLRLRGLDVHAATDVGQAVEILGRRPVGVMVVTLNGAGLNGLDALHRLRVAASAASTRPRLVVITDRHDARAPVAQRHGADGVLCKPVDPGQFITTVETLLPSASPQAA